MNFFDSITGEKEKWDFIVNSTMSKDLDIIRVDIRNSKDTSGKISVEEVSIWIDVPDPFSLRLTEEEVTIALTVHFPLGKPWDERSQRLTIYCTELCNKELEKYFRHFSSCDCFSYRYKNDEGKKLLEQVVNLELALSAKTMTGIKEFMRENLQGLSDEY